MTYNIQVERIFADRINRVGDDMVAEYLVKWQGLPYAESTWYGLLSVHQTYIGEYSSD
jgi:Chromo (CHRromatin Organisation MOdifier) domain